MAIPLATTTIQVLRPVSAADVDAEFREPGGVAPVGSPVRAHISTPTGNMRFDPSGQTSTAQYKLQADPCDLRDGDTVRDGEGNLYRVAWAALRRGPLEHVVAGISETERIA